MKKTSTLIILLILAFALILCGCEKEDGVKTPPIDPTTLAGPFSIFEGGMTFYVDVQSNRAVIYEDGSFETVFQTFSHAGVADVEISKAGIKFEDFTFDGFCDFYFPQRTVDGIQYYYGFIWEEETMSFVMEVDFLNLGNPTLGENCILSTEVHNGETVTVEYYYKDGKFTHEYIEEDPYLPVAKTYIKGFLAKEDLEVEFTSWELIDSAICRKYYVYEGETVVSAVAVNADGSRVFYSPLTESYFEIIKEGEAFVQSDESFGKMPHTNEVFTYVPTGFESLSEDDRELYGKMYADMIDLTAAQYTEATAETVIEAVFEDYPVLRNYVRYKDKGGIVTTEFYVKWAPYKTADAEEIKAAVKEYEEYTDEIINTIPVGLEPMEKYLFIAQRLQLLTKGHNHDHSGEDCGEPLFEILISGDSKSERLSRTYKYLCEKAQLYCRCEDGENVILQGTTYFEVDLEEAFNYAPGSERWLEKFIDID